MSNQRAEVAAVRRRDRHAARHHPAEERGEQRVSPQRHDDPGNRERHGGVPHDLLRHHGEPHRRGHAGRPRLDEERDRRTREERDRSAGRQRPHLLAFRFGLRHQELEVDAVVEQLVRIAGGEDVTEVPFHRELQLGLDQARDP